MVVSKPYSVDIQENDILYLNDLDALEFTGTGNMTYTPITRWKGKADAYQYTVEGSIPLLLNSIAVAISLVLINLS